MQIKYKEINKLIVVNTFYFIFFVLQENKRKIFLFSNFYLRGSTYERVCKYIEKENNTYKAPYNHVIFI